MPWETGPMEPWLGCPQASNPKECKGHWLKTPTLITGLGSHSGKW